MNVENFHECQTACELIIGQVECLQAVYLFIGGTHMNWNNLEVESLLVNIMSIRPEDIGKDLKAKQVIFFTFSK